MTWEERLRFAVELHELAVAGHRIVASEQAIESARLRVVAAIDAALEAGVPEAEVDRLLERLAAEAEEVRPPQR